MTINPKFLAMF